MSLVILLPYFSYFPNLNSSFYFLIYLITNFNQIFIPSSPLLYSIPLLSYLFFHFFLIFFLFFLPFSLLYSLLSTLCICHPIMYRIEHYLLFSPHQPLHLMFLHIASHSFLFSIYLYSSQLIRLFLSFCFPFSLTRAFTRASPSEPLLFLPLYSHYSPYLSPFSIYYSITPTLPLLCS